MTKKLKLKAEDIEDITVFAAYLQDAVTKMEDITFQATERRFALMFNRFMWENDCTGQGEDEKFDPDIEVEMQLENLEFCRIRTGIHFENVVSITRQNISQEPSTHPLELLTIEAESLENKNFLIDLIFAGEGVIRLEVELIDAYMRDIGDHWVTKFIPDHGILHDDEE